MTFEEYARIAFENDPVTLAWAKRVMAEDRAGFVPEAPEASEWPPAWVGWEKKDDARLD